MLGARIGLRRAAGPRAARPLRLLIALGLALGSLAAPPAPVAWAGMDFCSDDPVFSLSGEIVDINVQIPVANVPQLSPQNPLVLRVDVPKNVQAKVLVNTSTFLYPLRVDLATAGPAPSPAMTITFHIYAPDQGGAARYPVRYMATSRLGSSSGQGTSGSWFAASFPVPHA